MKRIVVELNVLVKSSLSMKCGLHSSFVTDFMLLSQCGGVFFREKKYVFIQYAQFNRCDFIYIKRIEFDMCHNNIACDRQFFYMHKRKWMVDNCNKKMLCGQKYSTVFNCVRMLVVERTWKLQKHHKPTDIKYRHTRTQKNCCAQSHYCGISNELLIFAENKNSRQYGQLARCICES